MHKEPLFESARHVEHCPKCGSALQLRRGKKKLFLGCSAYPACDYLKPLQQHDSKILKVLQQVCPQCAHPLVLRQGHYGMFIGCSHFPSCDYIVHDEVESAEPQQNVPCPSCQKGLLVARRGRQGKVFYACDQFPKCRFSLPNQPYNRTCPKCGYTLAFHKNERHYQCCHKACRHQFEVE
ncbi:hypothetical protein OA57_00030 [Chelonobacter oris]|uniref:DNA topoisomerase type IA zn finger domain-containing protein n=1 Tax=Chelonobacter oris TaxID=505317 RepID=A0A0A3AQ02_9PAST|nr:topoisomerase DNA-binding C4 zinc finger domain-containing protein [Chelonobacter oris]KGQ71498.1 hypothetical protein OA57_00030 [Chelonobacter oris]